MWGKRWWDDAFQPHADSCTCVKTPRFVAAQGHRHLMESGFAAGVLRRTHSASLFLATDGSWVQTSTGRETR